MNEAAYQTKLINKLRALIPNSIVMKNDSSYMPGVPDILILYKNHWAMLEIKLRQDSRRQPNQDYYIERLGSMSFVSFIYPEIEEEVLYDLQRSFGIDRQARIS